MYHRAAAAMPRREQDPAVPALVLHVFQPADQIRYAAETETDTRQRRPRTVFSLLVSISEHAERSKGSKVKQ